MKGTVLTVAAGAALPVALQGATVVELAPGEHAGSLFVESSIDVRGPGATLNAGGRGSVAHIVDDGLTVKVSGLTLRGGNAQLGAGVFVEGASQVVLHDVVIQGGTSPGGGNAIGAIRGELTLERCRIEGEALFTGISRVTLKDTVVTADLLVREGAQVVLIGGAVEGSLDIRGTTTRAPTVTVQGTTVHEVHNNPDLPGTLTTLKTP